jgi:peptidoglycan-associated lipoprotein
MSDIITGRLHTLVLLALASLLLAGCPKTPSTGALNSAGSPSAGAGGVGMGAGSGLPSTGAGRGGARGVGPASTTTPGARGGTGTTLPALPSPAEFAVSSALRDVQFEFDKYDIRPSEKAALDANARWLKVHTRALVLIEGHCDERGTNEYNLALGERRARATRDYLASAGITDSRITIVSYGEERPLCTERTDACWTRNRRAHFLVKEQGL